MQIDKYFDTNLNTFDLDFIQMYKQYDKFIIWKLNKDSIILEIWPWNWGFTFYLQNKYNLDSKNINLIDISKSVIENLENNIYTKKYNLILWDVINFLENTNIKFDLIIMRHVLEHFEKKDINKVVPLLERNLNNNWICLIEVPNIANPLWLYMWFQDYSHYTHFTSKSLKECIIWNSNKLDIKCFNIYYNLIFTKNIKWNLTFFIWKIVEITSSIFSILTLSYKNNVISPRLLAILNKKND